MMLFLQAWLITTVLFLAGDCVWLVGVMNKFFVYQIRHLMNVTPHGTIINYISALCAYIIISTGLTWFIVVPLLRTSYINIFLNGAFLGFCLYGVYEFTNHATLKGWPLLFLNVDILWGTVWCGIASVLSVLAVRYCVSL